MNLIVKLLGLGWIWNKVDGLKTYIAAALAMATGLGGLCLALAGLGQEILPLLAAHNLAGLLAFAKVAGADPNVAELGKAWLTLIGGLGLLGIGHKIDKTQPQAQTNPPEDAPHA